MKRAISALLAAWCALQPSAASAAVQFLQFGAGARAAALANAFSAVADDATAVYWNPADLTRLRGRSATFMHAAHVQQSSYEFGAYAQPFGKGGSFGASVQHFSYGKLEKLDASGVDQGTFSPNDSAAAVGYGYRLGDGWPAALRGFSFGAGGKLLRSQIAETRSAMAADLGLLTPDYTERRIRFAATAQNLGGKLKSSTGEEALPTTGRLGVAVGKGQGALLAADLAFSPQSKPAATVGVEYALPPIGGWGFAMRVGFDSRVADTDGFSGVATGIGVAGSKLAVDYALVPLGVFGLSHRISVGLAF